jgi:hypothetical protein
MVDVRHCKQYTIIDEHQGKKGESLAEQRELLVGVTLWRFLVSSSSSMVVSSSSIIVDGLLCDDAN